MSDTGMTRKSIVPAAEQSHYDRLHFSPATRVGDTIWVSGRTGIANNVIGQDMDAQARMCFEGLKAVLAEAGASLADIVELVTFHTDMQNDMRAFSKVKDEYLPGNYPAWTAVGVTQLMLPEFRVEVRAVAVAGSGRE
jgi:enamine deaminase RidA (YjgF/YER057c/UK114 family)